MINEQRALATLDLALKNAFETLDKYSLWVKTADDTVTFNLIDAVPTLESNGTGIFLKPITVPSFAAIRSSIFGPPGASQYRDMYWNLNFKAVNGWTFSKYRATDPTTLSILVDTSFGSADTAIGITKTNVTENLVNSSIILDADSSLNLNAKQFYVDSETFYAHHNKVDLGVSSGTSRLLGSSIVLGTGNGAYSAFTFKYSKNSNNIESNAITIGPTSTSKQSTYSMLIRSGSLDLEFYEGKDFKVKSRNGSVVRNLFAAIYSNGGYDASFLANGFKVNSLNVGDVKTFSLTASDSLILFNDYGKLSFTSDESSIWGDILKLSSNTKTSLGSKTSVNIGIEDSNGDISNEIVITKGAVTIPNLYVQKKANYSLSGVKHLSSTIIDPSVIYYPDGIAKTISQSSYAFEYSKNIKSQVIEETSGNDFATTVNDLSGSTKAYLTRLVDNGIEFMSADATYDSTNIVVTSKFTVVSVATGLSSITPYKYNASLKMISTPNGMYIFVREVSGSNNYYNVYYSIDGLNFNKLHSYDIADAYIYDVSIDYVTVGTVDYIWFTHLRAFTLTTNYWCEFNWFYTYVLFHLENNCSVVKANVYNAAASQSLAGNGDAGGFSGNMYALYGACNKVVVYPDGNGKSYALMLGTYGSTWEHTTHEKDLGAYLGGGKGTLTSRTINHAHGLFLRKFTAEYNDIKRVDVLSFSTDNGNGNDFLVNGSIVDFSWDGTTGIAVMSSENSTRYIEFNSTTEVASSTLTNSDVRYSQYLSSISDTKIIKKMLVNSNDYTKAFICNADNAVTYAINSTLLDSIYGTILSSLGVIYYDWTTSSIVYYDNGTGGVAKDLIEVIVNKSQANGKYDLTGAVVDYIGANYFEYGDFFSNFVLSSVDGGDFTLTSAEDLTDRRVYVESNQGDITSIIESSNTSFTPTKLSSVIGVKYNKLKSIVISLSNIYNTNGKISEVSPVVRRSSIDTIFGALNFHIEPISYLVKNRKNTISTFAIGNYTISSTSISGLYALVSSNNPFSGYRIPYVNYRSDEYSTVTLDQINFSNQSDSIPEGPDMNSSLEPFYVTLDSTYCHIHDNVSIGNSTIIVTIPFGMIDPTDATFDPSCAIVNEFNNVVSLKLPYMFAIRSQNCGSNFTKGRSNLILGLTEVAEIGGDC